MSRSDIPNIEDRRPFYLYVDEFQNFATDSFATILSEARKYGLNLTVANQYISQMSDTVRNDVFGNVGSMISFRVSADDAPILAKQFEPQFEPNDLLQMHNRHFIINMVINGEKSPAFSATTLTLPPPQVDNTGRIIENTRLLYSRSREEVEAEISNAIQPKAAPKPTVPPVPPSTAAQWPINAQTNVITPDAPQTIADTVPQTPPIEEATEQLPPPPQPPTEPTEQGTAPIATGEDGAPKKKRRRRRKKSGGSDELSLPPVVTSAPEPAQPPTPTPKKEEGISETEIRLR